MRAFISIFVFSICCSWACDPPNSKNTNQLFNVLDRSIKFPDVTLKTLGNQEVKIQDYLKNDKIKLVCFWATWCGPCSLEFNDFNPKYKAWQNQYNFEIIGISIDEAKHFSHLDAYVKRKQWPYEFLYDENKSLSKSLKIENIPHSFLVNQKGEIVHINYSYHEQMITEIEAMLSKMKQDRS